MRANRWLVLLGVALAGVVLPSFAQITSAVQGTVTDPAGLVVPDARIVVTNVATGSVWQSSTDAEGFYRITALPAGTYSVVASRSGFATAAVRDLAVAVNRTVVVDFRLTVGTVEQEVIVQEALPLLETNTAATGESILPRQITELPLNGRNYLDLLQLVPGVAINHQADQGTDSAVPVLGERGGNTVFLIDGMPNRDEFGGGAAAQFNQDTIQEFQVLTTGFKAEFGHGSGGVVNVITKSGTNDWHGSAFLFHRNSAVDRDNSLDPAITDAPLLLRWDYGLTLGGPILKERFFFFGSAERIRERRELNFSFPPATPQTVQNFENSFNDPNRTYETRLFARLDETLGAHRLSQEINVTNGHVTNFLALSQATSLPSTRRGSDARTMLLGFRDTALLGNPGNPLILSLYFQRRDEPSREQPAHPAAGPATTFNIFSSVSTFGVFGDLGTVTFGADPSPSGFDQEYTAFGGSLAKNLGKHEMKFGAAFLRTHVDGDEFQNIANQIFCTEANFINFGPTECGFFTLLNVGGLTPADNLIRLRNNYLALYAQNDWRVLSNLTLNFGLRWEYDSEFDERGKVSPRVGVAWSLTPKTVVRGSFGLFYDRFRLGLARRVPDFGGASISAIQPFSYPQLFYNLTTIAPVLFGICVHPLLTDAQIASMSATCPLGPFPVYGYDHLNNTVVAGAGGTPIPGDTVVNLGNVQALSGLNPDQFLAAVNAAVPLPGGFSWFWGPFGSLSHTAVPGQSFPTSLDPRFDTPYTRSYTVGVQQQLFTDLALEVDYVHKDIENILGVRQTNLAFISRIPGNERTFLPPSTGVEVNGFGPWYDGSYDALILSLNKRFSRRFALAGSYTFAHAEDNARIANLGAGQLGSLGGPGYPTDSFVGIPPVVTDPISGMSNANGSFTASNGNFVPEAGKFYNGANLDRGKSSLALDHSFFVHALVEFPWRFQVAGIFRAQSGFPFSRATDAPLDMDGNLNFNTRDLDFPRNGLTAPAYVNMDLRVSKQVRFGERLRVTGLIEFFNLFNRQNPASVETVPGRPTPLGRPLQVLPGMETQVGLKIEF